MVQPLLARACSPAPLAYADDAAGRRSARSRPRLAAKRPEPGSFCGARVSNEPRRMNGIPDRALIYARMNSPARTGTPNPRYNNQSAAIQKWMRKCLRRPCQGATPPVAFFHARDRAHHANQADIVIRVGLCGAREPKDTTRAASRSVAVAVEQLADEGGVHRRVLRDHGPQRGEFAIPAARRCRGCG
jgi:hypothetical protein